MQGCGEQEQASYKFEEIKDWKEAEGEIYQLITMTYDLTEKYDTYEEIIAASEIIVTGEVDTVSSYLKEGTRMETLFTFMVDSVLKGTVDGKKSISVCTPGGRMKVSEYMAPQKEYLQKKKSTDKDVEKEIQEHGDEYVEVINEDTPNVQQGENLVLCLRKSSTDDSYVIVGMIMQGVYRYDKELGTIYELHQKINNNTKGVVGKVKEISIEEFIEKCKE